MATVPLSFVIKTLGPISFQMNQETIRRSRVALWYKLSGVGFSLISLFFGKMCCFFMCINPLSVTLKVIPSGGVLSPRRSIYIMGFRVFLSPRSPFGRNSVAHLSAWTQYLCASLFNWGKSGSLKSGRISPIQLMLLEMVFAMTSGETWEPTSEDVVMLNKRADPRDSIISCNRETIKHRNCSFRIVGYLSCCNIHFFWIQKDDDFLWTDSKNISYTLLIEMVYYSC